MNPNRHSAADTHPVTFELDFDLQAPSRARELLRTHCPNLPDHVELLTSELVTNAIIHGRPPVTLSWQKSSNVMTVSVRDSNSNQPVTRDPEPLSESGRGITIVQALSHSWGIDVGDGAKTIWFKVRCNPPT